MGKSQKVFSLWPISSFNEVIDSDSELFLSLGPKRDQNRYRPTDLENFSIQNHLIIFL